VKSVDSWKGKGGEGKGKAFSHSDRALKRRRGKLIRLFHLRRGEEKKGISSFLFLAAARGEKRKKEVKHILHLSMLTSSIREKKKRGSIRPKKKGEEKARHYRSRISVWARKKGKGRPFIIT